jgi:hypothetical protein
MPYIKPMTSNKSIYWEATLQKKSDLLSFSLSLFFFAFYLVGGIILVLLVVSVCFIRIRRTHNLKKNIFMLQGFKYYVLSIELLFIYENMSIMYEN